jgi:hypothetical protein
MFERFTVAARQSLFCALYKAEERKGDEIAGQDLLGGLMMVAANEILRFASEDAELLRPALTLEQWKMQLQDELASRRPSTPVHPPRAPSLGPPPRGEYRGVENTSEGGHHPAAGSARVE